MLKWIAWALLLVTLLCGSANAAGDLLARWDFDQVTGDRIPDRSGSGNDLTVRLATLVKGLSGKALSFDGKTTSAICFGSAVVPAAPGLTLEAWVQPASADFSRFPAVLRKEGHYALRFSGDRLGFIVWQGGVPQFCNSNRSEWKVGEWVHVAGTYDGKLLRLYVNGAEDAGAELKAPLSVEASPLQCFVGSGAGGYRFDGVIDEVRILSRALTPDELRERYQSGLAALAKEGDLTVTPQVIGKAPVPFRKPPREIAMVRDGFVWVDAEDFRDYGGWTLDTQFVHLMGSGYLIAGGTGAPVADATVQFTLPRAGKYRLWVRARNWLKEHSPGQFTVLVNGKPTEHVLGRAASDEWLWEQAGDFDLPAGPVALALHDLTGYYGRCDALILTTDAGYVPPAKLEDVIAERARLTGLSLKPQPQGEWDVIVVGGGAAGCCAAIAAARTGAKTAMIQDRPVLGGNASTEAGVPINGAASAHPNARESGIIEEAGRIKARYGYPQMSQAFADLMAAEPSLTLFLNQRVDGVRMDGKRIAAVRSTDTLTGAVSEYRARMFIDCTGDGWVGYYAGAKFRYGRESRDDYNESHAPEAADEITMSGCLMGGNSLSYRAVDTGQPSPYTPPPWAPKFASMTAYGRQIRYVAGGNWWMEHRGDVNDLWNPEQARDELIRISYGYWDFIKNVWENKAQAANYRLVEVPLLDAKRETRRLIGDYVLTQNDCLKATIFPDAISYGGWPLDVHHPEGIYSSPEEGAFHSNTHVPIYTIPYRCLYSANIENLLMAGRDMSVTHIALGTVRVQGTLSALGQAAGTAAALALRHRTTPRGVYEKHLHELQQRLLKDDQYIPGIAADDPGDLARKATEIACSSEADYEQFRREDVQPDNDAHAFTCDRAMVLSVGTASKAVYLLLSSEHKEPLSVTLHGRKLDGQDEITAEGKVPPGENWVRFDLKALPAWMNTAPTLLWLPLTDGLSWRLMRTGPRGAYRAYGDAKSGNWTPVTGQFYAIYSDPPLRAPGDYHARNLTDGLTRPNDGKSGLWASDPALPLPQWAELHFAKAVKANTVYLTFDTDVNAPYHDVALVPQCVRDYEVTGFDGKEWSSVAKVTGNFQRRRIHRFGTQVLTRLRLTVTATNGVPSTRVHEVRLYSE